MLRYRFIYALASKLINARNQIVLHSYKYQKPTDQKSIQVKAPLSLRYLNQQSTRYEASFQQKLNIKISRCLKPKDILSLYLRNRSCMNSHLLTLMVVKLLLVRDKKKQNDKYFILIEEIQKRIYNTVPEDIIKILYAIRKEKLTIEQILPLRYLIQKIIRQFGVTNNNMEEILPSLQVISKSSSIKLLHSINYLYIVTGPIFQALLKPLAEVIIKQNMYYKDIQLIENNKQNKEINVGNSFRVLLVLQIIFKSIQNIQTIFLTNYFYLSKSIFIQKKDPIGCFIQNSKRNLQKQNVICSLYKQKKQLSVKQKKYIKKNILTNKFSFEIIVSPIYLTDFNFAVKAILFSFCDRILFLNKQIIQYLKINDILTQVINIIIKNTRTCFQKYFQNDYVSNNEKEKIILWHNEGNKLNIQFLFSFLHKINQIVALKIINIRIYSYVLFQNILFNNFSSLSYPVRCLLAAELNKSQLTAQILKEQKEHARAVKYFGKSIISQTYLFQKITLPQQKIKLFLRNVMKCAKNKIQIQRTARLVAKLISSNVNLLNEFIKTFLKCSTNNCIFKQITIQKMQQNYKSWTSQPTIILQNISSAKSIGEIQRDIQQQIRKKLRIAFHRFKLVTLVMENMSLGADITKHPLFEQIKTMLYNELNSLFYQKLLTVDLIDLCLEIKLYFKSRNVNITGSIFQKMISSKCIQEREKKHIEYISYLRKHQQFVPQPIKKKTSIFKSDQVTKQQIQDNFAKFDQANNIGYIFVNNQKERDQFNNYLNIKKCSFIKKGIQIKAVCISR